MMMVSLLLGLGSQEYRTRCLRSIRRVTTHDTEVDFNLTNDRATSIAILLTRGALSSRISVGLFLI